jgi:hypothetical protein
MNTNKEATRVVNKRNTLIVSASMLVLVGCGTLIAQLPEPKPTEPAQPLKRSWLAGDSHIHSEFSPSYDTKTDPANPNPPVTIGGDAIYKISKNAEQARAHGLQWMVATDHGGPNHSKINMDLAYPELLKARQQVPELLTFVGMELNLPAMDHHTLMIPKGESESKTLFGIESKYDKNEIYPVDAARDTEAKALETVEYIKTLSTAPVIMANHPSRSATGVGTYGLDTPAELRNYNNAAPNIYVGFEGAPGHQAAALKPDGSVRAPADEQSGRGAYSRTPTQGGFDQMTANVGGLWDSMLGEGRRFWIVATSDSHENFREGGIDFWPGEYQKTYVKAEKTYEDVIDGLRNGRSFVTSGDLISELDVTASAGTQSAEIGGTLKLSGSQDVKVSIRLRDPGGKNFNAENPAVSRVDLIVGQVTGPVQDKAADKNSTTRVEKRFGPTDVQRDGEIVTMTYTLPAVTKGMYLRVRGTSTDQLEPVPDPKGENPWSDLWFYSNPIFIEL